MSVDPSIIVALIGGSTVLLGQWVATRHAKEARDIVKGNGHGNVTAIVERIEAKVDSALDWQGAHDAMHRRTHAVAEQAATSASAAAELSALPSN